MTSPRSARRRQLLASAALTTLTPATLAAPAARKIALGYDSPFPADFVFGVAAASAQIEGAAFKDGKGESVWDRFARIPGKVHNGDTPDVACDHYHRFDEDFALMASLGMKTYRLSIAWPRIYPKGDGELNQAGLDFYHRLFASMKKHGITPWVTLFHWDLPQALEDRGGWTSRVTVDAFAQYADTVVKAFAKDVKHWITLNEILCFTLLGYGTGSKAPGRKESNKVVNQTYHHALLCHGHGVRAVRKHGGKGAQVGLTDNCSVAVPVTEKPADIAAAKAWFIDRNAQILGAIHAGRYTDNFLKRVGADAPDVQPGDFDLISLPTDFLGLNIYSATYVRAGKAGPEALPTPVNYPRADSTWLRLTPQCLYWGTRLSHEAYGHQAIYITENGCGYDTEPVVNGEVFDLHRRDYVRSHLREVHRAISDGVPLKGYFLWSFIDNYEWEDGYQRRFGIVHCDFATQTRTPKLSARYYSDIIKERRIL
ncbi:GH1 family beta-glucosidase [Roseateles asaccharophilus]|uniref:Beta-glucosidase n=1 Tax=Roseateles asaccharophilus TaxID=582607 RepID=A0ABU2A9A4_9BURK|nr:GH1 family beta-glucosidase [Roseateles asaccharophilus]MDR7333786.1 beta-glucosidase [Roseateles asaccharophilus]